jgi:sporulation protein YlmC with PRC-barrel domain
MKMLFCFAAAAAISVAAAEKSSTAPVASTAFAAKATNQVAAFHKVSSFVGMPIKNDQGAAIGKVTDLAFDLSSARIGYAVVSLNEEGQKSRQVAVPLSALKPREDSSHLVLNVSPPVLAASESLVEGAWPPIDAFEIAVGGPARSESGKASSAESE